MQDKQCLSRDSKRSSPECKSEVLQMEPTCSLNRNGFLIVPLHRTSTLCDVACLVDTAAAVALCSHYLLCSMVAILRALQNFDEEYLLNLIFITD
jgi:hypothetical protein